MFVSEAEAEELREMLEEMDSSTVVLSDWEKEFIVNLIDEWEGCFTERQAEIIQKIYREKM